MSIKVSHSRILNGTTMWCNGKENGHQYAIKIHKDFRGISYIENGGDDKEIYRKSLRGKDLVPGDYATMFVFLCAHFGLEK